MMMMMMSRNSAASAAAAAAATTPSQPPQPVPLTRHLRETLQHSRAVLDDWVAGQVRAADAQAAAAAQQLRDKQRAIDAASAQLLALQLEGGCRIAVGVVGEDEEDDGSSTTTENLAHALVKRKELEQQVRNQTASNTRLDAQLEEKKKQLEGTNNTSKALL